MRNTVKEVFQNEVGTLMSEIQLAISPVKSCSYGMQITALYTQRGVEPTRVRYKASALNLPSRMLSYKPRQMTWRTEAAAVSYTDNNPYTNRQFVRKQLLLFANDLF